MEISKKSQNQNGLIFLEGLFFIILSILIVACGTQKAPITKGTSESFIKISPESSSTYTNPSLKRFITNNEGASVVVRDNKAATEGISGTDKKSNLCSLIESALVKARYNVRDRQIFESVMNKMGDNIDYVQLCEKTGTDLIFEVIEFSSDDYSVENYYTVSPINGKITNPEKNLFYEPSTMNQGYDKKGNTLTYSNGFYYNYKGKKEQPVRFEKPTPISYVLRGYHIEIKVIMLRENKIGGTYKYYYTPCDETKGGCRIKSLTPSLVYYDNIWFNKNKDRISPQRDVKDNEKILNELSNFISFVVDELSKAMEQ